MNDEYGERFFPRPIKINNIMDLNQLSIRRCLLSIIIDKKNYRFFSSLELTTYFIDSRAAGIHLHTRSTLFTVRRLRRIIVAIQTLHMLQKVPERLPEKIRLLLLRKNFNSFSDCFRKEFWKTTFRKFYSKILKNTLKTLRREKTVTRCAPRRFKKIFENLGK